MTHLRASGTEDERRLLAAMMMLVWAALGFKLAFAKGQLGTKISWIGGPLWIKAHRVRAFVKQPIIDDIQETLILFLTLNVLAKNKLHSLIGKLNHAAGLLIVMRPFLEPLWAAFGGPSPDQKSGCVWTHQIRIELEWFHTFSQGKGAKIERFF